MKKEPTYTDIRQYIRKVKTIKQLNKAKDLICGYNGSYAKTKVLIEAYNRKNERIRIKKQKAS